MASPFVAKDGSRHTNRETARRADARFDARSATSPAERTQRAVGGASAAGDQDPLDGPAIARRHGPAIEVNILHSASKHTVHAEHYDGHTHDTEHPTREAAHRFAAQVAGVKDGADDGQEQDDPEHADDGDEGLDEDGGGEWPAR